jgi:hypothetical protein
MSKASTSSGGGEIACLQQSCQSVNFELNMNCVCGPAAQSIRRPVKPAQGEPQPVARFVLAFALILFVAPLAAQQTAQLTAFQPITFAAQQNAPMAPPPQPVPEAAQQPAPSATEQQPGAGTQLQTGTSSGIDADTRLENLLADYQYFLVAEQLDHLPPAQAQFYRGILANRSNDLKQSVKLLTPLIDQIAASGDTVHEKLLREALAEDFLRLGDWAKAAQAYQTLDARLHAKLSPDEQDEIEMPLKMLPLAKDNPPTTVEPCDPFALQVSENPLGLIDVPVFVDARPHTWMLDPTEPFNLIARSTAKEAGLKVSDETATIRTLTGRPIPVRVTVIPRFTIGGQLTLRNMTAFVFDDADFQFPGSGYHVEGVLGYPALAAIGSLTVTFDDTIQIRPAQQIAPASKDDLLIAGAPFFLDGDQVIVALGPVQNLADPSSQQAPSAGSGDAHDERMFAVDAGGQQTYLTSRYFDEHAAEFSSQKMELFSIPGQQSAPQPAYIAEDVPLAVGNTMVDLHEMRVLTQPLGSAARDDVYGVLGIDALEQLKSYTFDYRTMRFSAQPE